MAAIERNWKRISEHEVIFFPLAHGSSENRIQTRLRVSTIVVTEAS
jgi:hypothetical protein